MKNEKFSLYSKYYDVLYLDKNYLLEVEYVIDLLVKNNVPGKKILEWGCGGVMGADAWAEHDLGVLDVGVKHPFPAQAGSGRAGVVAVRRGGVGIVLKIEHLAQGQLLDVAQTARLSRFVPRFGQGGQEHGRQNRDDGDDDKQLDEGESFSGSHG